MRKIFGKSEENYEKGRRDGEFCLPTKKKRNKLGQKKPRSKHLLA
jgi:hypothetical protein